MNNDRTRIQSIVKAVTPADNKPGPESRIFRQADRGRESVLLPLPPNRTGGFPAYGSPVGRLLTEIDISSHELSED